MTHFTGEKLRAVDVDAFVTGLNAIGGVGIQYTPSWITTGAGADPSIGNGFMFSRYVLIGKWLRWQLILIWGSTTNGGTGDWEFGLPPGMVTQNNGMRNVGTCMAFDSGIGYKHDIAILESNSSFARGLAVATGGYYTATTPQTWAVNDQAAMELWAEIV